MRRNYKKEIEILSEEEASFMTGLTKRELLISRIPKIEEADGAVRYRRSDILQYQEAMAES